MVPGSYNPRSDMGGKTATAQLSAPTISPSGSLAFRFILTFHNLLTGLEQLYFKSPCVGGGVLPGCSHGPCLLRHIGPPETVHPLRLPSPYQPRMCGRCQGLGAVAIKRSQV